MMQRAQAGRRWSFYLSAILVNPLIFDADAPLTLRPDACSDREHHVSQARTSARLLASGCTALVLAGCSFKPGCANRDARAAIEKDARSSVEFWLKSIGIPSLGSKAIFSLVATYETGRSGDTRSRSGSMSIKVGTDKVEVPITYEVIGTDEGSTMYRWDGGFFGKGLIAQALTGGLAGAIEKATEPPASSSTEAMPPTEDDHADRTAAAMKRWRNGVSNISRR